METSEPNRMPLSQVLAIALLSGSLTFSYLYSRLEDPQRVPPVRASAALAQTGSNANPAVLAENAGR